MINEFTGRSKFRAYYAAARHEIFRFIRSTLKRLIGRTNKKPSRIKSRYSEFAGKRIVLQEGIGLVDTGISWFYTAFERGSGDPLTNFMLDYVERNLPRDSTILLTGCGTGIMVFHLADSGFTSIEGSDLLPECIAVANRIRDQFGYRQTSFRVMDGFNPKLDKTYDLITAVHWVFSAWMGNYGNDPAADARNPEVRMHCLKSFLGAYIDHLAPGGLFAIELTDSVADYREPLDHPHGERSVDIYPVRHSPEQVREVAGSLGLEVLGQRLSVSYGHQPRTLYILQKDPELGRNETRAGGKL